MAYRSGRHFLQIPGPTNVPDRIQRAMHAAVMDHRGPDFARLGHEVLEGLRTIFRTSGPVIIFPSSGSGGWEAAIVNTLSPGDKVLMYETGQFATLWAQVARRHALDVEFVAGDWRHGVDPADVERRLAADRDHAIQAVMVVHNETSNGVTNRIAEIRKAINAAHHPALFMIDAVSSLAAIELNQDAWQVDVVVAGSQKGLMLPPGLAFNAVSEKALAAAKSARLSRSYWDWQQMLKDNVSGYFPYTPATTLLYGLKEAIAMLHEEGLANVFARHNRHAAATRAAVEAWGLENLALDAREFSSAVTAVLMPQGHDADAFRKITLEKYDLSLGTGLGKVKGRVFRIGHLGDFNDLMLMATLAGVEMGLRAAAVPYKTGGVLACGGCRGERAGALTRGAVGMIVRQRKRLPASRIFVKKILHSLSVTFSIPIGLHQQSVSRFPSVLRMAPRRGISMNNLHSPLRFDSMDQPTIPPADAQPRYLQRFVVKLDSRIFAVPVEQVDWIESAANYVRLHVGQNTYLVRATMTTVESSLDPRQFIRVHRNAIVNLGRVQEYSMPARGSMTVQLKDGSRVPLSRGYQPAVRKLLQGGQGRNYLVNSAASDHPIT
jgi:alanine-glyoxylate transaminase/serine-glyoxylate transaminase/serine-pyruvate transaminase